MVALRRFQDLMKMLACQSPGSPASNRTAAANKSTQTPDLHRRSQARNSKTFTVMPNQQQQRKSPVLLNRNVDKQRERVSSQQMKRRNCFNIRDNNKQCEMYSSDEMLSQKKQYRNISSPVISSYIRNRNISSRNANRDSNYRSITVSPVSSYRSSYIYRNEINQEKSITKKPIDGNNLMKNNDRLPNDRALKVVSRNSSIRTPPAKESKFSRYTPLPAINSCDNNNNNLAVKKTSPESRRRNRRLVRQLTYKVINPIFVKGPLDLRKNCTLKSPNKKSTSSPCSTPTLKKSTSRCSTPSSHLIKRSKTIVIKKNKNKANTNGSAVKSRNNSKISKNKNLKSFSNPDTSLKSNFYESKGTTEKDARHNWGEKRLLVKNKLLEAAEKIKQGQPIIDNAFWVPF